MRRAAMDASSPLPHTTFDEGSVIGFKDSQAGVEQVAFGNDDHVIARSDLVATKNLSYQSFRPVPLHRSAELFRGRDAQPSDSAVVGEDEDRGIPAVELRAAVVNRLELRAAAYVLGGAEPHAVGRYSLLTVSRLRPLARRRFRTSRPFLVLIRTRKPCAFFRWRLFGWNVRLPFMTSLRERTNRQC